MFSVYFIQKLNNNRNRTLHSSSKHLMIWKFRKRMANFSSLIFQSITKIIQLMHSKDEFRAHFNLIFAILIFKLTMKI